MEYAQEMQMESIFGAVVIATLIFALLGWDTAANVGCAVSILLAFASIIRSTNKK